MNRRDTLRRGLLVALLIAFVPTSGYGEAVDLDSLDIVLQAVPDGPIAHVDGASVPADEFVDLYKSDLARLQVQNPNLPLTDGVRVQVGLQAMGTLVEREILYAEAQRRNISAPQSEVEAEWEEELERLRHAFAMEDEEPLSEAEVLERAGATRDEAIDELEKALVIEKVRSEIAEERGVSVSDEEVASFFDEHSHTVATPSMLHLKQIFISGGEGGAADRQEAARQRAQEALNRIRAGQSFEAVAREYSEGQAAEQGGDLGPTPAEQLPPFFVSAAGELGPGEVSGIIESEFGLHIVKLVDREEGEMPDFEAVAPEIRAFLKEEEKEQVVRSFVAEKLEDDASVRIYLELERQLAFRPDLLQELGMVE